MIIWSWYGYNHLNNIVAQQLNFSLPSIASQQATMKIQCASFLLLLLLSIVSCTPLRICHTNDFHAKYLEVGSSNVGCAWYDSVSNKCYSGISRVVTALSQYECDVKVQAGDFVQGSTLDTVFKDQIAIAAYDWARYDIAVFGNHEFDYGNAHINSTIWSIADFGTRWLSSNVYFDGNDGMQDLPIYRYLEANGVCWVAALTTETLQTAAVEPNVRIEDEDESLTKAMAMCSEHTRRNVIAVTHQGYQNDIETCKQVKDIALIIGGHSHTNLDNGQYPTKVTRADGSVCWVTTAYAHGRYMGVIDVEFDTEGVMSILSSMYVALDYRIGRDAETFEKVMLFDDQVSAKADEPIGTATRDVVGGQVCRGPDDVPDDGSDVAADCGMGSLICDAMLAAGGNKTTSHTRVCMTNGGNIRNSFAEGVVTLRDLVNVLPFGNSMTLVTMTGSELRKVMEYGFSVTATDNRGGYPGAVSNMQISTTMDGDKADGEKVSIDVLLIDGKPLVESETYEMLTNNYIVQGGDGYTFPNEGTDWGTLIRDTVQTYLESHDPYDPVPETEARITMKGVHTEQVNQKVAAMNDQEPDDATIFVENDKKKVETELDKQLVQGPKVKRCRKAQCKASL